MEAVRQLRLERQITEVHVAIVEAMHRNTIPWSDIEDGQWHTIDQPHSATYQFTRGKHDSKGDKYYKQTLMIAVPANSKSSLKRSYVHFVEKRGTL